jgi:hypothetical protein
MIWELPWIKGCVFRTRVQRKLINFALRGLKWADLHDLLIFFIRTGVLCFTLKRF